MQSVKENGGTVVYFFVLRMIPEPYKTSRWITSRPFRPASSPSQNFFILLLLFQIPSSNTPNVEASQALPASLVETSSQKFNMSASTVSIPMSANEDALKVYQSSLRKTVLEILVDSGLSWTTLNLFHRGTNPQRLNECPPTIVVGTSETDPLQKQGWKTVEGKIQQAIGKATKTSIKVEILQTTPRLLNGKDVGLPLLMPPPLGYSFGPIEEETGPKARDSHSGTVGGYVVLESNPEIQLALTCNHVANSRSFMGEDDIPESAFDCFLYLEHTTAYIQVDLA